MKLVWWPSFCLLCLTFLCQWMGKCPSLPCFSGPNRYFPSYVLPFLLRQDLPQEHHFPFVCCCRCWLCSQRLAPGCPLHKGKWQGPAPSSSGKGKRELGNCYFIPSKFSRGWEESLGSKTQSRWWVKRVCPIMYCVSAGWVSKAELLKSSCESLSHLTEPHSSNMLASDWVL